MKTVSNASLGLATALALLATTVQADVRIDTHEKGRIHLKGTEIEITAADGSLAEIGPAGDLKIRGKAVPVTDAQRRLLAQYSRNLLDMEKHSDAAEQQAWRMAPGILGTALEDLFSGASSAQFDHDTSEAAGPLKAEFLELCNDVKAEHKVQDQISDALPDFKPYAVISEHDTENNCHADDKD